MNSRQRLLNAVGEPPFLDARDLNWQTVQKIAAHSTHVKAALTLAAKEGWTREQALVLAVYALAEHSAALLDDADLRYIGGRAEK